MILLDKKEGFGKVSYKRIHIHYTNKGYIQGYVPGGKGENESICKGKKLKRRKGEKEGQKGKKEKKGGGKGKMRKKE